MRKKVLVKHIHLICTDELQKALKTVRQVGSEGIEIYIMPNNLNE